MKQSQALSVMMSGRSVFLTGAPGAGKTYVLNRFIQLAKRAGKNVAVTASTGIAATHIGGGTIHSWSGLGIKDTLTQWDIEKLKASSKFSKRYNATDVLIIDEVSMLHGVRLDMVNAVAKAIRQCTAPFGGIQVILVGDLFQLPPVTRAGGRDDFVHGSAAWAELDPAICYLTEQHRVGQGDALLDLLEAMRRGTVNELHEAALQERLGHAPETGDAVTRLYAHNADVDSINQAHLAKIDDRSRTYAMRSSGAAAKREQLSKSVLAPEALVLKKGAEVMFVANNPKKGFVNGSRGTVVGFDADELPIVVLSRGREIIVEPHTWSLEEDGRIKAEVTQLPLRLAWAITIHKSQGMSLDAAEIDLSRTFAPGMGYVALSRVRSFDGVYLKGVNATALQLHPEIFSYDSILREASAILEATVAEYVEVVESAAGAEPTAEDVELFEKLRAWRLDRARRDKVAPYMVLHDATLHELATRRPSTRQALSGTKGLGPTKLANYAEEVLRLLHPDAHHTKKS